MNRTPEECPACGADVPRGARACPECGSDEKTGWSERAHYDSLGIPDDDESFDYQDFVAREFGGKKPQRKGQQLWVIVAILLLAVFGFGWWLAFAR